MAYAKKSKLKVRILITLIVMIIAVLVLSRTTMNIQKVLFKKKPDAAKKAAAITMEEEAVPVKGFKIKKMDFKDTLPCIGTIKGYKEIDLKFQVAGIIESFNFEEGEKIQQGDIMASLIQRDATLKLKYAQVEKDKNQKLFDIGAIGTTKLEQANLEYESAKSDLDKTNIYAVANGLLGSRVLDVGSYITPSDKVGVFIDIDKVYAEFDIIEKDIPKIALGQKAEIACDAFPNKAYSGVVDRIAPIVEGRSRSEKIKVEIDNKDGTLKPGIFARALIATYEKKEAIVIPASGLKKKENDYFVYFIQKEEPKKEDAASAVKGKEQPKKKGDILGMFGKKKEKEGDAPKPEVKEKPIEYGAIEIRKIKLGYMTQDLVEVEEGLSEDDMVVIEIQEELKDKAKVEILEVQEGLI